MLLKSAQCGGGGVPRLPLGGSSSPQRSRGRAVLSDMRVPCPGHEDPITHFTREAPLSAELVFRTVLSTGHRSVNKTPQLHPPSQSS